jgi:two-component system, OmpR family, sensor histidine kinase ResE
MAAERNIKLSSETSGSVPLVDADGDRLLEVLANLLDNALRYTPDGGTVSVRTESAENGAVIKVTDNGAGIPADELPFVFERFWRGDKSRSRHSGGSGIGLAIVRQIVELHHGTINVTSELNKGTTFIITLPFSSKSQA